MKDGEIIWIKTEYRTGIAEADPGTVIPLDKDGRPIYYANVSVDKVNYKKDSEVER